MRALTDRQQEFLTYICSFIEEHNYPPTIREMAARFSVSVKGAYDHVLALKKKGFINYDGKRSRAIEIIKPDTVEEEHDQSQLVAEIPIMGEVAAGKPILSEENREGSVLVPWAVLKTGGQYFAMRVQGDSMIGAGIFPDDVVVIEKTEQVRNNDIVVAVLDDRVTIKRFFRESSRICLQPENSAYKPIYCQDIRLIGKLAYLIRLY